MRLYIPFFGWVDLKKSIIAYFYLFSAVGGGTNTQGKKDQFGFLEQQNLSEQKKWIEQHNEVKKFHNCIGENIPNYQYISKFSEPCKILFEALHLNRTLYNIDWERNLNDLLHYMPPENFNGEALLFIYSRTAVREENGIPRAKITRRSIVQKSSFFQFTRYVDSSSKIIEGEDALEALKDHPSIAGYTIVARASNSQSVCYTFVDNLLHNLEHVREALRVYDRQYVEKILP